MKPEDANRDQADAPPPSKPAKPKKVNITVTVRQDLRDEVQRIATEQDENLTRVIERALNNYVKHHTRPELYHHDLRGRPHVRPIHPRRHQPP